MAMRFAEAQRAQNPDLAEALALQQQQANALKQGEAAQKANYMNAGVGLAGAAPEGTFSNAWDIGMGGPTAEGVAADSVTAGGSELLGEQAIAAGLEAQGGATAAAAVPEIAAAAEGAAAASAAGGGGATAALGSMGPMGWAALAALGLGLM